jgi:hypothetical protein
MTPHQWRWSGAALALLVACVPAGPVLRGQSAVVRCPFEIVGIWKPTMTAEANPLFLSFSTDGWVSVLESTAEGSPLDFDVAAQAKYRLIADAASTRIVFAARRGNDLFPTGTTSWDVADYGDASFVTVNPESGERTDWARVQTHRYYMTFAARSVDARGGSTFVMWNSFDGRNTTREALGVHAGGSGGAAASTAFGPIPSALSGEFTTEGHGDARVMLRLELSETDYRRTHAVFADWNLRAERGHLPAVDPYRLVTAFVGDTLGSLNRCGARIEVPDGLPVPSADTDDRSLPQHLLTFIQRLRRSNEGRHVGGDRLPFPWERPPAM